MNIEHRLLNDYSKNTVLSIADEIGDDPEKFAGAMDLLLGDDKLMSQRCAWVMSTCLEVYPSLADPYIYPMVDLFEKDVHDAVKRCVARSLWYVKLPEELHGKILHICFGLLMDRKQAVAVRVFSMSVIHKLAKTYPEIRNELVAYLEEEMDYGSAGFKSRARKIINNKI